MGKTERSELLEYFLAEAEDYVNVLSRGIPELEGTSDRAGLLEDLFRAAHTLKGAAAIVRLPVTSTIAHSMEDVLEAYRSGALPVQHESVEALMRMLDAVAGIIRDVAEGKDEKPESEQAVTELAAGILRGVQIPEPTFGEEEEQEAAGAEPAPAVEPAVEPVSEPVPATEAEIAVPVAAEQPATPPAAETQEKPRHEHEYFFGHFVRIDLRKIEEMFNLIGEITIMKNHMLRRTKDASAINDDITFAGKRLLEEVNTFAERHAYSLTDGKRYLDPLFSEFGELEFDRYDEQNLFSRKLQEITEDINEALKSLTQFYDNFQDDIKNLDKTVKFLRSDLSEARMIEIGKLFQRFARPIKEMARQYDKRIDLRIEGQGTKIDRVIFENLFDPLMHMIRNSVSHGIETSDERARKGKKREGTITLAARREGINIIIEIKDDGAGIETGRVLDEAVKRGLVKDGEKLSREDILGIIFLPGFSTAGGVDMTSGRGVGMNAVRRQIADINGTLELATEPGKGTSFRIRVPSSLAITNVVVFSYGAVEFVMPTSLIEEIIEYRGPEAPAEESEGIGSEGKEIVDYRGTPITAKRLSDVFHLGANGHVTKRDQFVIVCSISNRKAGLIVDDIIGQEETIIKPVNRFLEGLSMYSGITISGDGRVRLVLNPLSVFEEESRAIAVTQAEPESEVGRRILVVDDSLSVRKFLSNFLEGRKFIVFTATNGGEALKFLEDEPVDLVITDLEMPVMHGYDLVARIRSIGELKELPIIVLTSRSNAKHREKAFELGADDYLVKPLDEKALMASLKKHLMLPAEFV